MRLDLILVAALGLSLVGVSVRAGEASAPTFKEVKQIISQRCQSCHSNEPKQPGIYEAAHGIKYDTAEQIRAFAKGINATAVQGMSMPPGNATDMTDGERKILGAWFAAGAKTE